MYGRHHARIMQAIAWFRVDTFHPRLHEVLQPHRLKARIAYGSAPATRKTAPATRGPRPRSSPSPADG